MATEREMAEAVARWRGWSGLWFVEGLGKSLGTPPNDNRTACELPSYADSLDAMREVEDEIERRGLLDRYRLHLHAAWCKDHKYPAFTLFLVRATPANRLEAAYMTIQEVESAG